MPLCSACTTPPNVAEKSITRVSSPSNAERLAADAPASGLLERVRARVRAKHYSIRTEDVYVDWVRRFILHFDRRHPKDMGAPEVEQFLTDLAVEGNVSASTQNQAKSALLFLYRDVLGVELDWLRGVTRAKAPERLPVVLTEAEVLRIFRHLRAHYLLMAQLLYGSGLRLMECVRLRVKDVDFERGAIVVRDGKGQKDRITMLPRAADAPLRRHLRRVRLIHDDDLREGVGAVYLPFALARKFPGAAQAWGWQYVFPSTKLSVDPRTGVKRRHHIDEQGLQRALKQAVRDAGIAKPATPCQ